MSTQESRKEFYPNEENLGRNCQFWNLNGKFIGCNFPKVGLEGRTSCEGVIDDVCLYKKSRRIPPSLTAEQITELKTSLPKHGESPMLPPGDIY